MERSPLPLERAASRIVPPILRTACADPPHVELGFTHLVFPPRPRLFPSCTPSVLPLLRAKFG
jgi:hypothetical protein